jgi:hypothetical protein
MGSRYYAGDSVMSLLANTYSMHIMKDGRVTDNQMTQSWEVGKIDLVIVLSVNYATGEFKCTLP